MTTTTVLALVADASEATREGRGRALIEDALANADDSTREEILGRYDDACAADRMCGAPASVAEARAYVEEEIRPLPGPYRQVDFSRGRRKT